MTFPGGSTAVFIDALLASLRQRFPTKAIAFMMKSVNRKTSLWRRRRRRRGKWRKERQNKDEKKKKEEEEGEEESKRGRRRKTYLERPIAPPSRFKMVRFSMTNDVSVSSTFWSKMM